MTYRTKDQGMWVIDVEGTETQRLKNQAALQILLRSLSKSFPD